MSRLIDADKCPCIICDDTRNAHCTYEHRSCTKFCSWLNSPAYSVEKVVTELEEIKDKYFCTVNEYQRGARDGAKWVKKNAIDIVRNGGKE